MAKRSVGGFPFLSWRTAPVSAAAGCVLALAACGGGDDGPAGTTTPPATTTPKELSTARFAPVAATTCDIAFLRTAVAAATGSLATELKTAALVAEGTLNGAAASATNPVYPSHCLVTGAINAHTGAPNDTAYANNFRLRLPLSWNGRFLFTGGGGNNGSVGNAVGDIKDGSKALIQGFAVVAQDSGHTGSAASFALDAEAYKDFAHESVHDASSVSKMLISRYYGMAPQRSYFVGCSNGGREAMVTAQRYDDFDGVVAGAPAMNIFDQWMQDVWSLRAVSEIVGTPAGSVPASTSAAFTDAQLAAISALFVARCDALDGLADGIVSNAPACQATPKDLLDLQCAASGGNNTTAQCLSTAQIRGLQKIYAGPRNSAGGALFTGHYAGGVEVNWRSGMLGSGPTGLGSWYASTMPNMYYFGYGHQGYPGVTGDPAKTASYPTAQAYVANFDFDVEPQKMNAGRLQMHGDNVDPRRSGPNFETFQRRGGKMIIYNGAADASVKLPGVIEFMTRLNTQYGATQAAQFARLFTVPGMGHCSGGKATDQFDELTPLMRWVELGEAPERIVAKANATLDTAGVGITRPLCPHPRYAKYNGSGDVNAAASFSCVE